MSASLHGDVASAIGQQVEQMILQAKKDSEARVRHELNVARGQLQQMEVHITELSERVGRCVRSNGSGGGGPDPSQTVDRAFLSQKISQLEQKWGSEVKALKQDLHRTILAHNHNSDLMRHHRDALDEARRKLDAQTQPKAEQVDAQIEKVDRMLRAGQAKQRALDALTERLGGLELQVNEMMPSTQMPFGAMMPPGMTGMAGMTGLGGREQTSKRAAKKDGELPSEEEVRARLLQAARAGQADGGATNFNAEAPVFVPRGAAADAGPAATATSPAKSEGSQAAEGTKESGPTSPASAGGDASAAVKEVSADGEAKES
mmetsp:Transcript_64310/g.104015  ORF Transcript_64310/g.104015 Transcript_64310/m.104015 type:complete len:318 (-) Transcript_64310:102-1055(-)